MIRCDKLQSWCAGTKPVQCPSKASCSPANIMTPKAVHCEPSEISELWAGATCGLHLPLLPKRGVKCKRPGSCHGHRACGRGKLNLVARTISIAFSLLSALHIVMAAPPPLGHRAFSATSVHVSLCWSETIDIPLSLWPNETVSTPNRRSNHGREQSSDNRCLRQAPSCGAFSEGGLAESIQV